MLDFFWFLVKFVGLKLWRVFSCFIFYILTNATLTHLCFPSHYMTWGFFFSYLTITIEKQRIDAVRTEPILLEGNGEVYWRLGGCGNSQIMLQGLAAPCTSLPSEQFQITVSLHFSEIRSWDLLTNRDRWFLYDNDSEQIIQKYITSLLR